MDFDLSHGLPIGILMFVGMLIARSVRKAGRARAHRGYPALATALGLEFISPSGVGIGKLRGDYQGHAVLVSAEDSARIVVSRRGGPAVELRNYAHFKRTPTGLVPLSFGVRKLDAWLVNRYAAPGFEQRVAADPALQQQLASLARLEMLKQLSIDPERIECVFDFGRPPFIPVGEVEHLLSTCVKLAQSLERIGGDADEAPVLPNEVS